MSKKEFWVIVYDLSNDRRRARLHTALLAFGTPVQYSVFECWLTHTDVARMRARVRRIIRPRKDHVRFYQLCAECAARVDTTAAGELTVLSQTVIV